MTATASGTPEQNEQRGQDGQDGQGGQGEVVVVGGYTAESGGSAPGLSCYRWRPGATGAELLGTLAVASPSYVVAHPSRPWLFAVSETSPARVSSVRWDPDGSLALLSTVESGGDAACHLGLSPDLRHVVVAHYGSGSVSSFALDDEGRLRRQDVLQLQGRGPDSERQDGPHAHQVVWEGEDLLVSDLGGDRVHRLRLGSDGRLDEAAPPVVLPAGSGPRHLVVRGEHLVVACELTGELWLGHRREGAWQEVARQPASTAPSPGPVQPSALVTDGRRLFVANRGPGTVAVVEVDADADRLVRVAEFACGGPSPRDLTLTADHLWVAHQGEDRVSVFALSSLPDPRPAFALAVPAPTCVVLPDRTGR